MNIEETLYWVDQFVPGDLALKELGQLHIAVSDLGEGEQLGTTVDFAVVDTGLETQDEAIPVRSELIAVARVGEQKIIDVLAAATTMLIDAAGVIPGQPGTMLPNLVDKAGLTDVTVAHGLFIAPYLWGGETPRMSEPDRLTVMLQLIMLTDSEYAYAVEEGVGPLQQAIAEEEIDLLDWRR